MAAQRNDRPTVLVRRLDPELSLPGYAHPDDAGLDLQARHETVLAPGGGRATVDTGIAVALPAGHVGFVTPRSGLAARHGITVLNGPGTVDAGYRGELRVTMINTDPEAEFTVRRGDRIAQLVVQRVEHAQLIEVDDLTDSARGPAGFGSSGGFGGHSPATPTAGENGAPVPSPDESAATPRGVETT